MSVVDDSFGHSMKPEERAVMPLAGGLMGYGYQCGMLWGAALAAGAQAYRLYGAGAQAEAQAVAAAQRLVKAFQSRAKHIDCSEITELNWQKASQGQGPGQILKFFLKGGPIVCFSMTADYARIAFSEIHAALEEPAIEAPPPPLSCAALLAQKMGAPEMHQVMAAGFAGGIGLSGGACGALGAAIWLIEMDRVQAGAGKVEFNSPEATDAIDRFVGSTGCEFECSKIAGRVFADVADHAGYLRDGGCAKVIEALAASGLGL
jgi:hypothetical protein